MLKTEGGKRVSVHAFLRPPLYKEFVLYLKKTGLTGSGFVNLAVEEYLRNHPL